MTPGQFSSVGAPVTSDARGDSMERFDYLLFFEQMFQKIIQKVSAEFQQLFSKILRYFGER